MQKDLADRKPDIETLVEIEAKLNKVISPSEIAPIKDTSGRDQDEYARLKQLLEDEARGVFMAKEKVEEFNSTYEELSTWLNDVINRHGDLHAVAVDAEVVKEQLKEHQVLMISV